MSAQLVTRVESPKGSFYAWAFWCPGCQQAHVVDQRWELSGTPECPTLSPSIAVTLFEPIRRCHLFVRSGRLEFLAECFHELAGTTAAMQDVVPWTGEPR